MAKIPLYEQNRLASSVVGTPGVFTAPATELGGIANSAQAIGNTAAQMGRAMFEDQLQERRRKEAEVRALNNRIAEAERDADVQAKVSGLDKDFTDLSLQIKNDHNWDTNNALPTFADKAQQMATTLADQEQNPLNKAEIRKLSQSKIASYQDGLAKWAETRQVPIMDSNIQKAAGNFSLSVNSADLSAADVGQKIQQYRTDTEKLYPFVYGAEGDVKRRNDIALGVENYLSATALNAPDLLEDRIKAFNGGTMIDPKRLNAFAGEQRRIAAEIKAANTTAVHNSQLAAKLESMSELIASSPTGDVKDADPAAAADILKRYGPNLSVDDRIRLQQIPKQASEEARKKELIIDERKVISQFGTLTVIEQKIAARIENQIGKLYEKGISKEERRKRAADLQVDVDQYDQQFRSLNAIKGTIKNPEVADLASLHMAAATERFGDIVGKLKNSPDAIKAAEAKNKLMTAVYPKDMNSLFPDSKRQAVYQYLYQAIYYDQIKQNGLTPDQMLKLAGNDKAVISFRDVLRKKTYAMMSNLGILDNGQPVK